MTSRSGFMQHAVLVIMKNGSKPSSAHEVLYECQKVTGKVSPPIASRTLSWLQNLGLIR